MRMRATPGLTLIRVALALPAVAIAAGATIPPAPELSPAQLQQLAQVKTWRITDHQDFTQTGFAAGADGFIPSDPGARVQTRTSTILNATTADAQVLAATRLDPRSQILVVGGTATSSGTIKILGMMELPDGSVSRFHGNSFSADALDASGRVLAHQPGIANFARTDAEVGDAGDKDFDMIGFSMSYPMETQKIVFKDGARVLLEVDPLSTTLRDAVAGTIDSAYPKNADERREALLNKVDAFEKIVSKNDLTAARNKLNKDIRKQVESWLVDAVLHAPGEEYDRKEVLAVIDAVDARLRARGAK